MDRLTLNKPVDEIGMWELAHNMFFNKDGEAWCRDYQREISCRELAREIFKKHCAGNELTEEFYSNDECFDEDMIDFLAYGTERIEGVIANYYLAMWGMTDIYEKLKRYEDTGLTPEQIIEMDKLYAEKCKELAEYKRSDKQGLLLKLPCKVGDTVYLRTFCEYVIANYDRETNTSDCPFENDCEFEECGDCNERLFKTTIDGIFNNGHGWHMSLAGLSMEISVADIGRIVFLTRAEDEDALKRMEDSDAGI